MSLSRQPQFVRKINVVIASPMDVMEERDAILKVFTSWNGAHDDAVLIPVMFESASVPALGAPPQTLLNPRLIETSDLLIGIFWSKLGTPTPTAPSGSVEEIREFIRLKGPQCVMLYFCMRDVPPHQAVEVERVNQFKREMQSRGLYEEYRTVEEFERKLYHQIGIKVRELLEGKLDLPHQTPPHTSDSRLSKHIDFGITLDEIATRFTAQMDAFDTMPDKYLALAAHVYDSVAMSLDRVPSARLAPSDRRVIQTISSDLKALASTYADYLKGPFPRYWNEGRALSRQLTEHVKHLSRIQGR